MPTNLLSYFFHLGSMKRIDVEIDRYLCHLTLASATLNVLHWMNVPNEDYFNKVWRKYLQEYTMMCKLKMALKEYK